MYLTIPADEDAITVYLENSDVKRIMEISKGLPGWSHKRAYAVFPWWGLAWKSSAVKKAMWSTGIPPVLATLDNVQVAIDDCNIWWCHGDVETDAFPIRKLR